MADLNDPESLMRDALDVAQQALHRGELPIACVLYDPQGQRLAQGCNQAHLTGDSTRHAEIVALAAAAQPGRYQPTGLTLVTTLEPCVMCWGAALELRVARIIYGLEAPQNGGSTRTSDPLRTPHIQPHILRTACRQLFVNWQTAHPETQGSGFIHQLLQATAP